MTECYYKKIDSQGNPGYKTVKFAKHYRKLDNYYFPTIRKRDNKLRTGNWYFIKSPSRVFKALLMANYPSILDNVPTSILTTDTDTTTREQAIQDLRQYYPDLEEEDVVRVLWFLKSPREDNNAEKDLHGL